MKPKQRKRKIQEEDEDPLKTILPQQEAELKKMLAAASQEDLQKSSASKQKCITLKQAKVELRESLDGREGSWRSAALMRIFETSVRSLGVETAGKTSEGQIDSVADAQAIVEVYLKSMCFVFESQSMKLDLRKEGSASQPHPSSFSRHDDFGAPLQMGKWPAIERQVRWFWKLVLGLLEVQSSNPEMLDALLVPLGHPRLLKFLVCFPGTWRHLLNIVSSHWVTTRTPELRMSAFLVCRGLCMLASKPKYMAFSIPYSPVKGEEQQDSGKPHVLPAIRKDKALEFAWMEALERCINVMYTKYLSAIPPKLQWRHFDQIRFIENCLVELLTFDRDVAYRIAFVRIKQLGLSSLEQPQKKRQKDNPVSAVSFKFILAARFWTRTMSAIPDIRVLGFPLTSILSTAINRTITRARAIPYTLHLLEQMNSIARAVDAFVPVGALLHQTAMRIASGFRIQKGSTSLGKGRDFQLVIRLKAAEMAMPALRDRAAEIWLELMTEHLGLLARHPSFPEISRPILFASKRLVKRSKIPAFVQGLQKLVELTEISSRQITSLRDRMKIEDIPPGKVALLSEDATVMSKHWEALSRRREETIERRIVEDIKNRKLKEGAKDVIAAEAETVKEKEAAKIWKEHQKEKGLRKLAKPSAPVVERWEAMERRAAASTSELEDPLSLGGMSLEIDESSDDSAEAPEKTHSRPSPHVEVVHGDDDEEVDVEKYLTGASVESSDDDGGEGEGAEMHDYSE